MRFAFPSDFAPSKPTTYMPAWFGRPCAPVDVMHQALPTALSVVGQALDIPALDAIKECINIEQRNSALNMVKHFIEATATLPIDHTLDAQVLADFREMMTCDKPEIVFEIGMKVAVSPVQALADQIEMACEKIVCSLPDGQSLWEQIKGRQLYGFCFTECDGEYHLSFESCDFFCHHPANLDLVPEKYQALYYRLMRDLQCHSFASFQWDAMGYFSDLRDLTRFKDCEDFGDFIQAMRNVKNVDKDTLKAVLKAHKSELVNELVENYLEERLYGTTLDEALEDGDSFQEGIIDIGETLEVYFEEDRQLERARSIDISTFEFEENCPFSKLFQAIYAHIPALKAVSAENCPYWHDGFTQRDETHCAFGAIIQLFSENHPLYRAMDASSREFAEQAMNVGENVDCIDLDFKENGVMDVLIRNSQATALLIAMLCKVEELTEPQ